VPPPGKVLWFNFSFDWQADHEPHGFSLDGGPDTLYYSYAIIPRVLDVPLVDVGGVME
jgi:hypothetical protein